MKCSICGRKLKTPQSKELGYGPVCYKRKFGAIPYAGRRNDAPPKKETKDYNFPGQISMEDYLHMLLGQ